MYTCMGKLDLIDQNTCIYIVLNSYVLFTHIYFQLMKNCGTNF